MTTSQPPPPQQTHIFFRAPAPTRTKAPSPPVARSPDSHTTESARAKTPCPFPAAHRVHASPLEIRAKSNRASLARSRSAKPAPPKFPRLSKATCSPDISAHRKVKLQQQSPTSRIPPCTASPSPAPTRIQSPPTTAHRRTCTASPKNMSPARPTNNRTRRTETPLPAPTLPEPRTEE